MIVNPRDAAIGAALAVLLMLTIFGVVYAWRVVAQAKRPKKIMAPESNSKYGRDYGYPPLTRPLPPPPKAPPDPRVNAAHDR